MKTSLTFIIAILLISCNSTKSPEEYTGDPKVDSVLFEIQKTIGNDWDLEVNDALDFSKPAFAEGEYVLTLSVNRENDTVQFILCNSTDENFVKKISSHHMLASCSLATDNYKYRYYRNGNYYLFLPGYPCWSAYSENGVEMIKKVFQNIEL